VTEIVSRPHKRTKLQFFVSFTLYVSQMEDVKATVSEVMVRI
jgi:hypothetical protein